MKAVRLCLIVCLVLMSASCALKTNWDLVGKWQQEGGTETLEFTRNGMINLVHDGVSLTCTYKFTDPKHMQIQVGSLGSILKKVSVSGGVLTMTDASGVVTKYTKVK